MIVSRMKDFVFVFSVLMAGAKCEIPEYIEVCPHDHPDLSGCIIHSIEKLRPRLKEGIPDLDIPPLEPLELDPVAIDSLGTATRIATNITNLHFWGASDFKILNLTAKRLKNGYSFRYEVKVPHLRMEGNYEIDSKLLFIALQGEGPFNANITNYQFECVLNGHKTKRDGVNHLLFEKLKCIIGLEKATIRLDNLFNGNPTLGKATNDVLNDNVDIFFEEIKPSINEAIESRFTDISNKVTMAFTYEELFP